MKKVLPIFLIFIFLLPFIEVEASSNKYEMIVLDEPIYIESTFFESVGSPVRAKFYNDKKELILSKEIAKHDRPILKLNNVKYISFIALTPGDMKSFRLFTNGIDFLLFNGPFELVPDNFFKDEIEDVKGEVTNLTFSKTFNSVDLLWDNPESDELKNIIIKQNGIEVAELGVVQSYSINGLNPETAYDFEVIAKYSDGGLSEPTSIKVMTDKTPQLPQPAGNISMLKADADYDRVDLSWTLPSSDNFKHVNIYRDRLDKSLLDKLLGVKTAMAATPIFETNGTYFNDLTVQPETKYEYLLTTTSTEGLESDGVSTTVTTLKNPEPEIGGGGYEKDPETGDFTYTWTKPTTGKVKVMINGKLHATVEASNGKIIIPAADMKFTFLGNPDVQLIPVDEEGNEGKPVKPPSGGGSGGGVAELPFSGSDLIKATFNFIKILGPIILLVLIIHLTPRLINVIKQAIKNKGVDSNAK